MSSSPTDSRPSTTPSLIIHSHHSPHPYFTPTHLSFIDATSKSPSHSWQSRRQRKGRYAIKPARILNSASEQVHEVMGRVRGLETKLKPGLRADISFWLAVTFTFGSAIWVINGGSGPKIMGPESLILTIGYLVWFPILRPILASTPFYNTAAAFAFIGGTVFEIGSYLGVVEALDRYVQHSPRPRPDS